MELESLGKMLVVVPHQDDEILLAGGILLQANRLRLPIQVCMVTNGDYGCSDHTVGHLRLRETLNGLEYLGLPQEQVFFLGYADTGMPASESFLSKLWNADAQTVIRSHCGDRTYGLPEMPTWHWRRFGQEAPYCRQSLEDDLDSLLDALEPDTIFSTSARDAHGDHSALYAFVRKAIEKRPNKPALYQGVVHSLAGDERWPLRDGTTPMTLPIGTEAWESVRFPLPPNSWDAGFGEPMKEHALRCHVTAMKPDAVDFLSAFVKADELFFRSKENENA